MKWIWISVSPYMQVGIDYDSHSLTIQDSEYFSLKRYYPG